MAFTKIQPQQLQLPTFFSTSGDIFFTDNSTGVNAIISRNLTGDFSISGSLSVNGGKIFNIDATNSAQTLSGSRVIAGSSNTASGSYNTIVAGSTNQLSGQNNVFLNSYNSSVGSGAAWNTLVAGYNSSFESNVTGSVIIADRSSIINATGSNSLIVSFASGQTFKGGSTQFENHINVSLGNSGIFGGDVSIKEDLSVGATSTFSGASTFKQSVIIDDDVRVTGNLYITGNQTSIGNIGVSGAVNISGTLGVSGLLTGQTLTCGTANATGIYISSTGALTGSPIATESWVNDQNFLTVASANDFNIDDNTYPTFDEISWVEAKTFDTIADSGVIEFPDITGKIIINTASSVAYFLIQESNFTGYLTFGAFETVPY